MGCIIPGDAQTRVCTIAHDSCVRKVYATLKRGTAGNEDKFLERCDCLAGCNEVEYRMEVDPNFVLSDKETGYVDIIFDLNCLNSLEIPQR